MFSSVELYEGYNAKLFEKDGIEIGKEIETAVVDIVSGKRPKISEVFCFAIARYLNLDDEEVYVSLLLEPSGKAGEYRRIGVGEYVSRHIFDGCEDSEIILI